MNSLTRWRGYLPKFHTIFWPSTKILWIKLKSNFRITAHNKTSFLSSQWFILSTHAAKNKNCILLVWSQKIIKTSNGLHSSQGSRQSVAENIRFCTNLGYTVICQCTLSLRSKQWQKPSAFKCNIFIISQTYSIPAILHVHF